MMRFGRTFGPHAALASAFIVCAMILGGGGSPNPFTEVLLQLVAVAVMLAWIWLPDGGGRVPRPVRWDVWLLAILAITVPVVQLAPLPPQLWHALAGQQDRIDALALVGAQAAWRPIALSPSRTLAGLLAIIPAALGFLATASLHPSSRLWLIRSIACVALVSAILGALQLSLGSRGPYLYARSDVGFVGFQAYKNATADVLLIGMAAAFVSADRLSLTTRHARLFVAGAVLAFFSLTTVLANSRTATVILPFVVVVLLASAIPHRRISDYKWFAIVLIAGTGLVYLLGSYNPVLKLKFDRFSHLDQTRWELWKDAWFSIRQSWPNGVGLGGAEHSLFAAERLQTVDQYVPNRVHNDYLEFLLEGGLLSALVLLAVVFVLARVARAGWNSPSCERSHVLLGCLILAIIACHSAVDYPLRCMSLACLAGFGAGLLCPPPQRHPSARATSHPQGELK